VSENERWFVLHVNPEPWAVGPLDLLRRGGRLAPTMGRNVQLHMYQQAVKGELAEKYAEVGAAPFPPCYELDFWFWRNTEQGNVADVTNLQKATEDALQGVLIANDRDVVRVTSWIAAQGPSVAGAVAFRVRWGVARSSRDAAIDLPDEILYQVCENPIALNKLSDNSWPPRTS